MTLTQLSPLRTDSDSVGWGGGGGSDSVNLQRPKHAQHEAAGDRLCCKTETFYLRNLRKYQYYNEVVQWCEDTDTITNSVQIPVFLGSYAKVCECSSIFRLGHSY